tara:strand:- start:281 stop:949 length:669 start_codon:yes stop_codon:yes gene_type:complete
MSQAMSPALQQRLHERLSEGLAALEITATAAQLDQLLALVGLLHKWNRAYNLTAVRDPLDMVSRHVLDSAAVLPWVKGPRVLDVGAGPGLPGLVLAILKPALDVSLLDSNGKKVRFQRQAVMELGLARVTPIQARVEAYTPADGGFDQLISRAFASLEDFVELTRPLLAPHGQWLAMKGPAVDGELERLEDDVRCVSRHALRVPYESAGRELVMLEPEAGGR